MSEQTCIDHKEYQARIKNITESGLRYTIKDCQAAIEALPEGHKAGYYADEINYCTAELKRRTDMLKPTSTANKHMRKTALVLRARLEQQQPLLNVFTDVEQLNDHKAYLAKIEAAIELIETNENEWDIDQVQ